jgi:hypothetical protein
MPVASTAQWHIQVMLWSLDPYAGELTGEKLAFEGRGAMQRLVILLLLLHLYTLHYRRD